MWQSTVTHTCPEKGQSRLLLNHGSAMLSELHLPHQQNGYYNYQKVLLWQVNNVYKILRIQTAKTQIICSFYYIYFIKT